MQDENRFDQATSLRNQIKHQQMRTSHEHSLPPRSRTHQSRKSKRKWKFPLLFVWFMLVVLVVVLVWLSMSQW